MLWVLTILSLFLWLLGEATSSPFGGWLHLMLAFGVIGLALSLARRPSSA